MNASKGSIANDDSDIKLDKKKIIFLAVGVLLVLVTVILVRTLLVRSPQLQLPVTTQPAVNIESVAQKLSKIITLKNDFAEIHKALKRRFPGTFTTLSSEKVNEHTLILFWPGQDLQLAPILSYAHMDVVPAANENNEWKHPPFSGEIDDEFIWGRGALDDKGSMVAWLAAIESLLESDFTPKRSVYFVFGHDEETGGLQGARAAAALFRERQIRFWFSLDEGSIIARDLVPGMKGKDVALIGISEKGYLSLDLSVETEGGHASMPPQQTAIDILAQALVDLQADPFPASLEGPFTEMMDFLLADLSFAMRLAMANRWLFSGIIEGVMQKRQAPNALIRTTMASTIFQAGAVENVLPQKARVTVNLRLKPGDSIKKATKRIQITINDDRIQVAARKPSVEAAPISSTRSDSFDFLHRRIKEVYPQSFVAPSLVVGGTDSKHFSELAENQYRFLPVVLVDRDIKRIHGTNERISKENLRQMVSFYRRLLSRL